MVTGAQVRIVTKGNPITYGAIENSSVQSGPTIVIATKHPVFPKGFVPFDGHRVCKAEAIRTSVLFVSLLPSIFFYVYVQEQCTVKETLLARIKIINRYFLTLNTGESSLKGNTYIYIYLLRAHLYSFDFYKMRFILYQYYRDSVICTKHVCRSINFISSTLNAHLIIHICNQHINMRIMP